MSRSLFAIVALMLPLTALAGEKRDAVLELLNAFEDSPSAAELQALGDGVDAELMEIAADDSVPRTRRGRAVTALQHFPSDPVQVFLEERLAGDDALLRRKAVWSLAVWGPAAVPKIAAALEDKDVQLRIAAAGALGSIEDTEAKRALEQRLEKEKEKAVLDVIRKSLGEVR